MREKRLKREEDIKRCFVDEMLGMGRTEGKKASQCPQRWDATAGAVSTSMHTSCPRGERRRGSSFRVCTGTGTLPF